MLRIPGTIASLSEKARALPPQPCRVYFINIIFLMNDISPAVMR